MRHGRRAICCHSRVLMQWGAWHHSVCSGHGCARSDRRSAHHAEQCCHKCRYEAGAASDHFALLAAVCAECAQPCQSGASRSQLQGRSRHVLFALFFSQGPSCFSSGAPWIAMSLLMWASKASVISWGVAFQAVSGGQPIQPVA